MERGASEGPATKRLVKRSLVVFRGSCHVTTKAAALGDVTAAFEESSLVQAPPPRQWKSTVLRGSTVVRFSTTVSDLGPLAPKRETDCESERTVASKSPQHLVSDSKVRTRL